MSTPVGLEQAGAALWSALVNGRDLAGGGDVLALEACRIADRLDRLDRFLSGRVDAWLSLTLPDDGGTYDVTVDKALAEARQQALAMQRIVSALPVKGGDDDDDDDDLDGLGTPVPATVRDTP